MNHNVDFQKGDRHERDCYRTKQPGFCGRRNTRGRSDCAVGAGHAGARNPAQLEGIRAGELEGGRRQNPSHAFREAQFFDQEFTLQGRARLGLRELVADSLKVAFSKESPERLRAGTYRYPFAYLLPPDLPNDYESAVTNSRIYYGVKAQVDLPLKRDLKVEQSLAVREPANPAATQALTRRKTKKFLFDSDSLMEAAVHLQKDTFYPGEELQCQLEVMNRAPRKEIRAATLVLRQLETAYADGRTHEGQTEIARAGFGECRFRLKERTTVALQLSIPTGLYPTIALGSLVKLGYELQVTLDIPWAVDAKLSLPVRLVRAPEPA
jgi:hypothetical protein